MRNRDETFPSPVCRLSEYGLAQGLRGPGYGPFMWGLLFLERVVRTRVNYGRTITIILLPPGVVFGTGRNTDPAKEAVTDLPGEREKQEGMDNASEKGRSALKK